MNYILATRYHDFSAGHRVAGHENKCAGLHGHNYRVHFTIRAPKLDSLGRVLDFSAIKHCLCEWLEREWDHKMLLWKDDPLADLLMERFPSYALSGSDEVHKVIVETLGSLVLVPFNPTAENMAAHLLEVVGPRELPAGVWLVSVIVEETRKCSAQAVVGEEVSTEHLHLSGDSVLDLEGFDRLLGKGCLDCAMQGETCEAHRIPEDDPTYHTGRED